MADWNWVTPQVALGSAPSPSWLSQMRAQGITDVLDLRGEPLQGETGPQPEMYVGTGIAYHYIPMRDRGGVEPVSVYQQGVQIIEDALSHPNGKILVHCAAGEYRSPSMVYAYLRATGLSPTDAWNMIVAARPIVNDQYRQYAEAAVPYLPHGPSSSGGGMLLALGLIGAGVVAVTYWNQQRHAA